MYKSKKINAIGSMFILVSSLYSCRPVQRQEGSSQGSEIKLTGSVSLAGKKDQSRLVKINFIPREGDLYSVCSGSFIRSNVVITAAHCLRSMPLNDANIEFIYGENFTKSMKISSPFEKSGVSFFHIVEGSDIALIYVNSDKKIATENLFRLPTSCTKYSPSMGFKGQVKIMGRRKSGHDVDKQYFEVTSALRSLKFLEENIGRGIGEQERPVGYGPFLEVAASDPADVKLATGADGGDSGGPWVQNDTVIGVTSYNVFEQSTNHTFGARICDFTEELENVMKKQWGQ